MFRKKNLFVILCMAVVMSLCFTTSFAMAANGGDSEIDSAGNVMGNGEIVITDVDKDLYWAGQDLVKSNVNVGYDALMAGQHLTMSNANIKGAARMAAQSVSLTEVNIGHNATIIGQSVSLNKCSVDTGFFCGKEIYFDGNANCLHISGQNVTINGKIDGDVEITAQELYVGEGAEITGTLLGKVGEPATIAKSAKIGGNDLKIDDSIEQDIDEEVVSDIFSGISKGFTIWWFLAVILMWLAMRLLMKKPVENAGITMMTKPGKMAATGAIVMIVLPIAALILMITVIGIPISVIMTMLYIILIMVSLSFSGSAAGQALFGKYFPKINPWGSTIIGVVVLFLINMIPYVGSIVKLAEVIFTMGFFAIAFYDRYLKKDKEPKTNLLEEGGYTYATEDEIH